jgi:hypothetical protein
MNTEKTPPTIEQEEYIEAWIRYGNRETVSQSS